MSMQSEKQARELMTDVKAIKVGVGVLIEKFASLADRIGDLVTTLEEAQKSGRQEQVMGRVAAAAKEESSELFCAVCSYSGGTQQAHSYDGKMCLGRMVTPKEWQELAGIFGVRIQGASGKREVK